MEAQISSPKEMLPAITGYDLVEKIGEGGVGEVYRAVQRNLQRTVAVKVLESPDPQNTLPVVIDNESRVMATLSHPHVVTIYDCGHIGSHNYLVMEYLAGSTLRSHMNRGAPWEMKRAAATLDAIAQAMAYIHEKGILHLDLKPDNVLFTDRGDIKITDFGLSAHHDKKRTMVEMGLAQGTLDYCAPEQRFGLPLDQRSDVFSMAVLAYELLTGELPGRVYQSCCELNPRLPLTLDPVLSGALARDPDDRYPTIESFRLELKRALGEPRRRPRIWIVSGLAASTLLAAGLALGWGVQNDNSIPLVTHEGRPANGNGQASVLGISTGNSLTLRPLPMAAPFGGDEEIVYSFLQNGSCNIGVIPTDGSEPRRLTSGRDQDFFATVSPDGRRIAFSSNRNGNIDIYVMDNDGGHVRQLTNDQGTNRQPAWSPDGKRLAFQSDREGNSEIFLLDIETGSQTNLTNNPGFESDPAWSPDGSKILYVGYRDNPGGYRLMMMDADGKNPRELSLIDNRVGYVYPAWSPDGKHIAYTGQVGAGLEIFVCDADGNNRKSVTKLGGTNSLAAWSRDGTRIAFQHTRQQDDFASLYVVNLTGGQLTLLLKEGGPAESGRPTWRRK